MRGRRKKDDRDMSVITKTNPDDIDVKPVITKTSLDDIDDIDVKPVITRTSLDDIDDIYVKPVITRTSLDDIDDIDGKPVITKIRLDDADEDIDDPDAVDMDGYGVESDRRTVDNRKKSKRELFGRKKSRLEQNSRKKKRPDEDSRTEGDRWGNDRTESSPTENDRWESVRSESYGSESGRSESYRSESNRTESDRLENIRTESGLWDSERTENILTESRRTENGRSETAGRERRRRRNAEDPAYSRREAGGAEAEYTAEPRVTEEDLIDDITPRLRNVRSGDLPERNERRGNLREGNANKGNPGEQNVRNRNSRELNTGNETQPEQASRDEDLMPAESESEERRPKKRRLTERERKVRQTIILLVIFAAACVALLLVVIIFRQLNKVDIPLVWSNEKMAYTSAEQSAMQAETAFSTDLCIGSNNVTREGLSLTGNERGALFSLDDRKVVFAKEMHEKIYPASITKLMTAILAFKSDKMDETVTIQWQDLELESGSQVVGLRIGDQVTMHDLMRGLLIHSGNDCAQAIARVVGGTQDNFVQMMNEELKAIGATESHFTNPTGLHDENHYTSVYDIYLMLHEAMKNDEFISIIQIPVYDFKYYDADGNEKHVTLDSTDRYLTGQVEPPKDVTVLGGKTGTTSAAGNCLSLISQNAYGQFFISVVTGALSKEDLYKDMNGLLSAVNV